MRIISTLVVVFGLLQATAQTGIHGTVSDQRGVAMAGVTLAVEGQQKTEISDEEGAFFLVLDQGDYTLSVSHLGYTTQKVEVIVKGLTKMDLVLKNEGQLLDEVLIKGIRADEKSPVTYTTLTEEELESRNLGQDLPILLNYMPSVVTTSDAGGGVGYTGIRVRGSDATRVNVTINGIPYNDSESQGTFWVDLPDFASSVENVQLQRGIGTSTNGSSAFGASLNLLTEGIESEAGGSISNSYGSFETRKHTLEYHTGKLNDHISLSGRLSRIASDGYIDRATSDLTSYFVQAAYVSKNTIVKALAFGGKEETYLAWNGIDREALESDRTTNFSGAYTDENGDARFYDNEVDHYDQDHYQLLLNRTLNDKLTLNLAGHYTWGRGYYEQFKEDASLEDYGITPVMFDSAVVNSSDIVRRKWLDNDFYGFTTSLDYSKEGFNAILGGGWNQYRGDHFGEVIWAQYASDSEIRHRYYDNVGDKDEAHAYLKVSPTLAEKWHVFADLQLRAVNYRATGDFEAPIDDDFLFFNPKVGVSYDLNDDLIYLSYARASREPNRTDYENGSPDPEILNDIELGCRALLGDIRLNANLYYMYYTDQLVLTGQLDDVGSPIRENIGESYRAGIELDATISVTEKLEIRPNVTFSQNKNIDFQDESGDDVISLGDTDIGFSPSLIAGNMISYRPAKGLELAFLTKYVGEQFMGNVEAEESILVAYLVNDLSISYSVEPKSVFKKIRFNLLVNNILDEEYVSNGYWGPGYSGYYPQAGLNVLAGIGLDF